MRELVDGLNLAVAGPQPGDRGTSASSASSASRVSPRYISSLAVRSARVPIAPTSISRMRRA